MAITIPTVVPSRFAAGDTVKFTRSFSDYSAADGWTYVIYFNGAQAMSKAGTTAADGIGFAITLATTDTDDFTTPGAVRYQERVTKAGETYTVGEGTVDVARNYNGAAAGAAQTHEEKTLAVIEAAMSGRLTSDIESYQIAGRAVSKIPIEQLSRLRAQYAAAVRFQRTGSASSQVYIEFTPVQ